MNETIRFINWQLESVNQRLKILEGLIRDAQSTSNGSIILRLISCGRCAFCPHPRWEKWVGARRGTSWKWHRVRIKSPMQSLKKDATDELKQLISETLQLTKRRDELVKSLSNANHKAIAIYNQLAASDFPVQRTESGG